MALVKCTDKDGKEHLKETVDARECVTKLGWTMEKVEPKPLLVKVPVNAVEKKPDGWGKAPPPGA